MRFLLLCLLVSMLPATAQATVVYETLRPGISASADYQPGERGKPAVLLLHGFLQTRDFPTVATLAGGLRDAGYPILLPTLSLGIPNRTQSLACEAVHRHSMEDDVAEISHWVRWLYARGHRSIVLFGHSFGSLQLLAYLSGRPDPGVSGLIGTSLIEAQIGDTNRATLIARLEEQVQRKQRGLVTQTLSFCKKYTSPADPLLSYVRWDPARTLTALRRSPVGVQLIMGGADANLGHNWLKALQHLETPMIIVPGAGHFMDGEHEFDLQDHTLDFLARLPQPSAP
jgi:pimeloyl-ACP methyl ester carboxylesterase